MGIKIGENILEKLDGYLKDKNFNKVYIITDDIVNKLYFDYLKNFLKDFDLTTYVLHHGEKSKSIDTVLSIYDNLIENNIDRNTVILSFGGGVVGDIAGFTASTYKRGLKYIQIPTTLLAQVDSSIGGKVGVDYGGYKNIIGSFYFPEATFIDPYFLSTLPSKEITCGLGEILKYGLIYDYDLFEFTKNSLWNIYEKDLNILQPIIKKSVDIKEKIVLKDKYDLGLRKILNFGHTIGHSIEAYSNFTKLNHGECVILGMIYESFIGKDLGLIEEDYFDEIYTTLKELISPIKFSEEEIHSLMGFMKNDKKNIDDNIAFVLPIAKGKVDVFYNIDDRMVINSLKGEWI